MNLFKKGASEVVFVLLLSLTQPDCIREKKELAHG